ncbi:PA14 domain-containing protein [Leptolyngbya sp. DQ-M1]|uniref:PA14 domain-containing protein n=1 Tax=Leptolyngbya sp. DQ-M1 TaxID=2933920 RepID=UPI00329927D3
MQSSSNSSNLLDLSYPQSPSSSPFDSANLETARSSSSNRLVFIDSAVENAQSLAASVISGTQVVLLNANTDGIDQISGVLAGYQNLDSVHILSHGSISSIELGKAALDLGTISSYSDKLRSWSNALSTDADILLYGCNVADGNTSLITVLSELTGADVAASADATGSADRGGNWILETSTSTIEAALPFDSNLLAQYTGILADGNGLQGEYFDNIDFTNRILTRTDTTVNFDWGQGSPAAGIGDDTFSVRWTGQVLAPTSGTYQFFTTTDDGVRLFVNDQLVINSFVDQPPTERTGSIALVAGQRYDIRMEYFENGYDASALLGWSGPGITKQIIPQSQLFSSTTTTPTPPTPPTTGTGNGLLGEYFDNIDFTNRILTRTDTTVNFDWGQGSPATGIASDTFSVRWTGQVLAPTSGTYQFFTTTDDGVRLFVNNQLVINSFADQPATERTGSIALVAGQRYDIRMEYFENSIAAAAFLGWSGPGITKQIIPQSQLFSTAPTTPTPPPTTPTPPPTGTGNGLLGEYFDNIDFTNRILTRTDTTVNFDWGQGSPAAGIGDDTFSVRWTGQVLAPTSGTYQFFTTTDDGVRLFVNNQLVINSFADQSVTERTGSIALVAGQRYDIRMEYFENRGAAAAFLGWSVPGFTQQIIPQSQLFSSTTTTPTPPPTTPTPPPTGTGNGLRGEYFDNIDFTAFKFARTDANINFNWAESSPDPNIAPDTFSVRWTGQVQPLHNDTYTFFTTTDDGVRLSVNGQLIIDSFADQSATERTGTIALQAGQRYDIVMEYFENGYDAVAQLGWFSANQARQIIPQSQLYSNVFSTNPGTLVIGTNSVTVNEDAGTVSIRIDRVSGSDGVATVRYTTGEASARAGTDFTATAGQLTFAAGETSKTVTIPILNDNIEEGSESFGFGLGETSGAALGINRTSLITIIDNDAPTSYTFSAAVFNENENAGTATITVQRSGSTSTAGSISYATSNGTATAGSDYTATAGTLSFAPGETSKTFTIAIRDDGDSERNETVNLTLSNPFSGSLGTQGTATLSIADNDFGNVDRQTVISGLLQPTAFDWTPGGEYMFVAQKNGVVRVARNGVLQQTPAVDISDIVNSPRDRGLLGLAVHPEFFNGSPYVYLMYSYDPPETRRSGFVPELERPDAVGNRTARLGRFTATINNGVVSIDRRSEEVILGRNSVWQYISNPGDNGTNNFFIPESGRDANGNYVQDFLIIDSESHTVGTVRFGNDGYLYVSNGDGASYNDVDPRAFRSLTLDNLSGKILRIDPITGAAPSSNPFFDGNAQSNRSKIWQYGLRNPFRFTINPTNGQTYIGDVGWAQWEEVNTGRGGENFGWVAYEGPDRAGGYDRLPSVQAFMANGGGETVTNPLYSYRHYGGGGNAINVGDFYNGNLIITDMSKGTVDALSFDSSGAVVDQRRFAEFMFGLGQIRTGADGNLYYASLVSGEVGRWIPV